MGFNNILINQGAGGANSAAAAISESSILKYSALVGLASGLCSVSLYYLYGKLMQTGAFAAGSSVGGSSQDPMAVLKQELVKELRQKEVNPPKDSID